MESSTGRVGVDKFPIDDEDDHLGSMWQADETATRTCYRAFWWASFALSAACLCWEVLVLQDLHGISSTPIFGIVSTVCHLLIMIYGDWAMNRQREGHVYFFAVLLLAVSFSLAIISCFAVASLERALRAVSERWPELDAITPRFTTSIGYKENFKQNEVILSVLLLAAALSSIPTLYRAKLQLGGVVRLAQARFALVMPPLAVLLLLCAMAIAASSRAFAIAAYALRPKEHNYLLTTLVSSAVASLFSFIDVACLFRWGVHPATHTMGLGLLLPCAIALLVTSVFVLNAARGVQDGMEERWQDIQPLVGHLYSWRSPQRYAVDCTFLLLQAGISGLFGGVAGVLVCLAHFWSALTLIAVSDSPPSVANGPIDSVFTMVGLEEDATYCAVRSGARDRLLIMQQANEALSSPDPAFGPASPEPAAPVPSSSRHVRTATPRTASARGSQDRFKSGRREPTPWRPGRPTSSLAALAPDDLHEDLGIAGAADRAASPAETPAGDEAAAKSRGTPAAPSTAAGLPPRVAMPRRDTIGPLETGHGMNIEGSPRLRSLRRPLSLERRPSDHHANPSLPRTLRDGVAMSMVRQQQQQQQQLEALPPSHPGASALGARGSLADAQRAAAGASGGAGGSGHGGGGGHVSFSPDAELIPADQPAVEPWRSQRLPRNMRHGGQVIVRGGPLELSSERSRSSGSVSSTTSSQLRAGGDLRVPSRPILGSDDLPLPPYSICCEVAGSAVWRALATTPRLFLIFGTLVLLFAAAWLIASVNLLVSNGRCAALVGPYNSRSGFYESNVSQILTAVQLEKNVEIDITNAYPRGLLELQVVEDGIAIEIRGTMRTLDQDRLLLQSRFDQSIRPVPLGEDTTAISASFGPVADWEIVEANKHCDMLRLVVVMPRSMAQQFRLRLTSHTAPVQVDVNSTASSLAEVVVTTESAPVTLRNLAIVGDPRVNGAPVINITSDTGPVLLSAVLAPGISVRTTAAPVHLLSVLSGFLASSTQLASRRLTAVDDTLGPVLNGLSTMPVPKLLAMMADRGHGDTDGARMLSQLASEPPAWSSRSLQDPGNRTHQAVSATGLPVGSDPWTLPKDVMHVAVAGDLYLEASNVGGGLVLSQAIAGEHVVASAGSDVVIQNAVATVVGDTTVTTERGRVLITNLLTVAGNRTLVSAGGSVIVSTIQANWLEVMNLQGPIRLTDLSLGVQPNKLLSGPTLNYTTPGINVNGNHDVTVLSVGASTAAITAGSNDFAGVLQCVIQGGSHPVLVEVDGGSFRGTYNVTSSDQARVLVEKNGQQQSRHFGDIGYKIPNAGQRSDSEILVTSTSGLIEFAVVSSPFSYV